MVGEGHSRGAPVDRCMANIFREHHPQVSLIADQRAVGKFGSDRTHEPFGETVRPRLSGRSPPSRPAFHESHDNLR